MLAKRREEGLGQYGWDGSIDESKDELSRFDKQRSKNIMKWCGRGTIVYQIVILTFSSFLPFSTEAMTQPGSRALSKAPTLLVWPRSQAKLLISRTLALGVNSWT